MAKKPKEKVLPVWNVFREDFNGKRIYEYNIFKHGSFIKECEEIFKKYKGDRETIEEKVKRSLMYYFWCKCEHEVIITGFPTTSTERKVDIYTQVLMNWERFFEYIWNNQDKFF